MKPPPAGWPRISSSLFYDDAAAAIDWLERTFRDNRLTRIFEGTNQINRLAVIEDQQAGLLARIARAVGRPSRGFSS